MKISKEEQLFFWEQMALLVAAGISVFEALRLLSETVAKHRQRRFLKAVLRQIELGQPFSEAILLETKSFSTIEIHLIKVGEASGQLPGVLRYIADLEKEVAITRKNIRKALSYPVMVILVSIAVLGFILFSIVPMFKSLYQSSGNELPYITQQVLHFSDYLFSSTFLFQMAIFLFCLWSGRYLYRKNGFVRGWWDQALLKIPIIGELLRVNFTRHFSLTIPVMLRSGITIINALHLFEKSIQNRILRKETQQLTRQLTQGDDFYTALTQVKATLPLLKTMVAVGISSGNLVGSLEFAGNYYKTLLDQKIESLIAFLEPVSMLAVGIIVGIILVSLYLPLFNLGMTL